ncbi:hypothetical protein ASC80_00765 [Afipia sp. Root123D2]|nr:hypothetical protein ASC80_00765 [Afipia sp. Root123D2]
MSYDICHDVEIQGFIGTAQIHCLIARFTMLLVMGRISRKKAYIRDCPEAMRPPAMPDRRSPRPLNDRFLRPF